MGMGRSSCGNSSNWRISAKAPRSITTRRLAPRWRSRKNSHSRRASLSSKEPAMHTQIYLFFDGRAEEALDFYKNTLGIEVEMLMRFKDAPPEAQAGCAPGSENKVMHSCFRLGDQRVMASDGRNEGKPNFEGFALSLSAKEEDEAERLVAGLGQG